MQERDKALQPVVALDGHGDGEDLGGGEIQAGVADEQREARVRQLQGLGEVLTGAGHDRVEGGGRPLDGVGVAGAGDLDEHGVDVVVGRC